MKFGVGRGYSDFVFYDLVRDYIDEIIKPEFPDKIDIPVKIDGRLRKSLGYFMYNKYNEENILIKFNRRLLNNIYSISYVEDVIKHEIIHYYCFLKGLRNDPHGKLFQESCLKFGCNLTGVTGDVEYSTTANLYETICTRCGKITSICKTEKEAKVKERGYISKCCEADLKIAKIQTQ